MMKSIKYFHHLHGLPQILLVGILASFLHDSHHNLVVVSAVNDGTVKYTKTNSRRRNDSSVCSLCDIENNQVLTSPNTPMTLYGTDTTCGQIELLLSQDISGVYSNPKTCDSLKNIYSSSCPCSSSNNNKKSTTSVPSLTPSTIPSNATNPSPSSVPSVVPSLIPSSIASNAIPSINPSFHPTMIPSYNTLVTNCTAILEGESPSFAKDATLELQFGLKFDLDLYLTTNNDNYESISQILSNLQQVMTVSMRGAVLGCLSKDWTHPIVEDEDRILSVSSIGLDYLGDDVACADDTLLEDSTDVKCYAVRGNINLILLSYHTPEQRTLIESQQEDEVTYILQILKQMLDEGYFNNVDGIKYIKFFEGIRQNRENTNEITNSQDNKLGVKIGVSVAGCVGFVSIVLLMLRCCGGSKNDFCVMSKREASLRMGSIDMDGMNLRSDDSISNNPSIIAYGNGYIDWEMASETSSSPSLFPVRINEGNATGVEVEEAEESLLFPCTSNISSKSSYILNHQGLVLESLDDVDDILLPQEQDEENISFDLLRQSNCDRNSITYGEEEEYSDNCSL